MSTRFDDRYARQFLAGWGTMDSNGHVANTAYLDLAADARVAFFAEHGAITVRSLVHLLASHDQQHLAGLQWLLGRIAAFDPGALAQAP